MFLIILLSMLIFIILIIMLLILNIMTKKTFFDKEKNSPFECGFDPKSEMRLPFSIQFFLIGLIFLIFDVEIILLLPMIKIMELSNFMSFFFTLNFFLIILILGIYHEWIQGALTWLK